MLSAPQSLYDEQSFVQTKSKLLPSPVDFFSGLSPVRDIAAGARHSLVVLEGGEMYGFGDNSEQQCAAGYRARCSQPHLIEHFSGGSAPVRFVAAFSGNVHNVGMADTGDMYSWGGGERLFSIGNRVRQRTALTEVDEIKGHLVSRVVLSHGNTVILTGDPSSSVGEKETEYEELM